MVVRPAWQQRLLAIPLSERCTSQKVMGESIAKMEYVYDLTCYKNREEALDMKLLDAEKALCSLVEVEFRNGGAKAMRYFFTEKQQERICLPLCRFSSPDALEIQLNPATRNIERLPPPASIVPALLALIAESGLNLYGIPGEKTTQEELSELKELLDKQFLFLEAYSPAMERKCNKYLEETLGASFKIGDVLNMLQENSNTLRTKLCYILCVVLEDAQTTGVHGFVSALKYLAGRVEAYLPLPEYKFESLLASFDAFEYQFKRIAWCYEYLSITKRLSKRKCQRWFKVAGSYIDLLKQAVQKSKQLVPADPFLVASFNRQLLVALGAGCTKIVTHQEIKRISQEMESAVDACAAWSPRMWKLGKAADLKIIKEVVLPFLINLHPTNYKNAAVHVYTTPGFLNLYVPQAVLKLVNDECRTCHACGLNAPDLLKCGGCGSVWYCDSECQKEGWKSHKKDCRRANKG